MDPRVQDEEKVIEIKIFPAIKTLRFWILTKYLNKTDFFLYQEEQEIRRFEQPNFKNCCMIFWMFLVD